MPPYAPGKRVDLTDNDDETINSDTFKSFIWRRRGDSNEYERGQLIVVFHSTGAYTYDVPQPVFEAMAERAYFPDKYNRTPFEWYDDEIVNWVPDEKAEGDGPLYHDRFMFGQSDS